MTESANAQTAVVQRFFTENSQDYSSLFSAEKTGNGVLFRQRLALAVELTSGVSGRLLDCACGPGEITTAILQSDRFSGALLVDLSPKMLEMARERLAAAPPAKLKALEFRSSDIFEFSARPPVEKFDLILCLGLIAHTGRLDELLARMKAMLTPTGRILLQSTLLDHWGTRVVRACSQSRYRQRHGYSISYFRERDILQSVTGAGLAVDRQCRFGAGLPFGDRLWAGANCQLEKKVGAKAARHGAEALYLLKNA
jgi:ubiquinone/menaquinone biosynthesis C-methylase UbiE